MGATGDSQKMSSGAAQDQAQSLVVRRQVNQIQYLMANVLKPGTHYGTVPGCGQKPTLLQPGAEKIAMMFHLVASYSVERHDYEGGHREYDVTCQLTSQESGKVAGEGLGMCTTLESKYRYRKTKDGRRVENPDIADVWNTVLKMAKKRAFVDAVKSTTAASDVFTQDIEDIAPEAREAIDVRVETPAGEQEVLTRRTHLTEVCDAIARATHEDRGVVGHRIMGALRKATGTDDFAVMTDDQWKVAARVIDGMARDAAMGE